MQPEIYNIVQILTLLIVTFGGLELIMRKKGIQARSRGIYPIKILPEDRNYLIKDQVLGYKLQEGEYKLTVKNRFEFTATHNKSANRITKSEYLKNGFNKAESQIWVFGCSNTYGWLLDDYETYPWLMQEKMNDKRIINFGIDGYGTLQSYLQFKEALKDGLTPDIVILGYCSFHANRNTMARNWLKKVDSVKKRSPFKLPYARIDKEGNLKIKRCQPNYIGLPLIQYLSFMNGLDNRLNSYYDKTLKSSEVTKKILSEFKQLCLEIGSLFIVVTLNDAEDILHFCRTNDITAVDISVPRGSDHPENTHYPYDTHPSALANKKYANKLIDFFNEKKLLDQVGHQNSTL